MVQAAKVWFGLLVNDLVGTDVPTLGEFLSADIAVVWFFASMASLMSLSLGLVSGRKHKGLETYP